MVTENRKFTLQNLAHQAQFSLSFQGGYRKFALREEET